MIFFLKLKPEEILKPVTSLQEGDGYISSPEHSESTETESMAVSGSLK